MPFEFAINLPVSFTSAVVLGSGVAHEITENRFSDPALEGANLFGRIYWLRQNGKAVSGALPANAVYGLTPPLRLDDDAPNSGVLRSEASETQNAPVERGVASFRIYVAEAGTYRVKAKTSANFEDGSFFVRIGGRAFSRWDGLPSGGAGGTWTEVTYGDYWPLDVTLPGGIHWLQFALKEGGGELYEVGVERVGEGYPAWVVAHFDEVAASDLSISGKPAVAPGQTQANLIHYGVGAPPGAPLATDRFSYDYRAGLGLRFDFHHPSDRGELRYRVLGSGDLRQWDEVHFDSTEASPPPPAGLLRRVEVPEDALGKHYFLKLEIDEN